MPRGNLEDWVALSLLPCIGPIAQRRALARYGDPGQIAHRLSPNGWLGLRGVGPGSVEEIRAARKDLRRRAEIIPQQVGCLFCVAALSWIA